MGAENFLKVVGVSTAVFLLFLVWVRFVVTREHPALPSISAIWGIWLLFYGVDRVEGTGLATSPVPGGIIVGVLAAITGLLIFLWVKWRRTPDRSSDYSGWIGRVPPPPPRRERRDGENPFPPPR